MEVGEFIGCRGCCKGSFEESYKGGYATLWLGSKGLSDLLPGPMVQALHRSLKP